MYDEDQLPQVARDNGPMTLPADVLLIVPVRNLVMFPGAVTQVALTATFRCARRRRPCSMATSSASCCRRIRASTRRSPRICTRIGTTVSVVRYLKAPNGVHHLICQGEQRFRTLDYLTGCRFSRRAST